jgi:DNA-binding transcriptional regulator YdaS (Cro superfamily)
LPQTVYSRALTRAAEILGGADALAEHLGVSMPRLQAWMGGFAVPPSQVFLQVVDIVTEHNLLDLRQRPQDVTGA